MSMKIPFPKTIRMQLMAAAAGITLIISTMTLTIYFFRISIVPAKANAVHQNFRLS